MKDSQRNSGLLNFIAFVSLLIFAVLQILELVDSFISLGAALMNVLNTIKNLGIILVFGITAWNFVANKSKGWKVTYWICIGIFAATILGMWIGYAINK